jgi:hypothetical protein
MSYPDAPQRLSERTVSWLGRVTDDRRCLMGVEYEHYLIPEDNTYKPSSEELIRLIDALLVVGFIAKGTTDNIRGMTPDPDPADWDAERVYCFTRLGNRRHLWFPCPCSASDIAALGEPDFQLVWSVESSHESGLKYPLVPFPEWGDAYYDLELHVGGDFVYHTSELIDPFDEVACACGRDLRYSEWDVPAGAEYLESSPFSGHYSSAPTGEPPGLPLYNDDRIYRLCPACGRRFRPQQFTARIRDGYTGVASQRAGGATYLFAVVIDCGKGFARKGWPIRATEEFVATVTHALGQDFYEIGDSH